MKRIRTFLSLLIIVGGIFAAPIQTLPVLQKLMIFHKMLRKMKIKSAKKHPMSLETMKV